jgi:hypothetical protein
LSIYLNDEAQRIASNMAKLPDLLGKRKAMMPLIAPPRFLIDEIVIVDVLALFFSICYGVHSLVRPQKDFPR